MQHAQPHGKKFGCLILAMTMAALLPATAYAQASWPSKPIKLIVPSSPGGSNDVISRFAADRMGARLGQPVII